MPYTTSSLCNHRLQQHRSENLDCDSFLFYYFYLTEISAQKHADQFVLQAWVSSCSLPHHKADEGEGRREEEKKGEKKKRGGGARNPLRTYNKSN